MGGTSHADSMIAGESTVGASASIAGNNTAISVSTNNQLLIYKRKASKNKEFFDNRPLGPDTSEKFNDKSNSVVLGPSSDVQSSTI